MGLTKPFNPGMLLPIQQYYDTYMYAMPGISVVY